MERWKGRDGEDDEDNESVKWKRQTEREMDGADLSSVSSRLAPLCSVGVSHMLMPRFTDWPHQELRLAV